MAVWLCSLRTNLNVNPWKKFKDSIDTLMPRELLDRVNWRSTEPSNRATLVECRGEEREKNWFSSVVRWSTEATMKKKWIYSQTFLHSPFSFRSPRLSTHICMHVVSSPRTKMTREKKYFGYFLWCHKDVSTHFTVQSICVDISSFNQI